MPQFVSELPAEARIKRARSALIIGQPFYGALALGLELKENSSVETMATDGASLFYAPSFVESLSEAELIGVLAHEVSHCAYLHHTRRGSRELALWNEAADYAINRDLIAAGFVLPSDALLDSEFDGANAESIYTTLHGRRSQQQQTPSEPQDGQQDESGAGVPQDGQDGAGEPQDGQGAPSQAMPDPGRCGGIVDAAPDGASMAEAQADMESRVRQAIAVAAGQGQGEVPASLARMLGELNAPRVDWREALAQFIDNSTTRVTDWNRRNKRFLGSRFVLPATQADSVARVAVLVDTSSSIDESVLTAFASEVQAMLNSGRVESVHVVYCDNALQGTIDYELGDTVTLEPRGGGGTSFVPAFEHVAEHASDVAAVIYLTDLDCSRWGVEPHCPVLWAAWGARRYQQAPPWGEVIQLDPHA